MWHKVFGIERVLSELSVIVAFQGQTLIPQQLKSIKNYKFIRPDLGFPSFRQDLISFDQRFELLFGNEEDKLTSLNKFHHRDSKLGGLSTDGGVRPSYWEIYVNMFVQCEDHVVFPP